MNSRLQILDQIKTKTSRVQTAKSSSRLREPKSVAAFVPPGSAEMNIRQLFAHVSAATSYSDLGKDHARGAPGCGAGDALPS